MKLIRDKDNRSRVIKLDSVGELCQMAMQVFQQEGPSRKGHSPYQYDGTVGNSWAGRKFNSLDSFATALNRPWQEGMEVMNRFYEELKKDLPEPTDRRRRSRWNDNGGTLDVNRLLGGDPVMYRDTHRACMVSPSNVALVCNVGGNRGHSADSMSWRGAATVACVDLLEAAGYSCEVWLWNQSHSQFKDPDCPHWFFCCQVKACGDPLDTDLLLNGMSAWYFRIANLTARQHKAAGGNSYGWGLGTSYHYIGGLIKHLDVSENMTRIDLEVPFGRRGALDMAKGILDKAAKGESDDL